MVRKSKSQNKKKKLLQQRALIAYTTCTNTRINVMTNNISPYRQILSKILKLCIANA